MLSLPLPDPCILLYSPSPLSRFTLLLNLILRLKTVLGCTQKGNCWNVDISCISRCYLSKAPSSTSCSPNSLCERCYCQSLWGFSDLIFTKLQVGNEYLFSVKSHISLIIPLMNNCVYDSIRLLFHDWTVQSNSLSGFIFICRSSLYILKTIWVVCFD